VISVEAGTSLVALRNGRVPDSFLDSRFAALHALDVCKPAASR